MVSALPHGVGSQHTMQQLLHAAGLLSTRELRTKDPYCFHGSSSVSPYSSGILSYYVLAVSSGTAQDSMLAHGVLCCCKRYSTEACHAAHAVLVLLQTEVQLYHCVPCGIAAGRLLLIGMESCILWAASLSGPLRGEVPVGLCSTPRCSELCCRETERVSDTPRTTVGWTS